MANFIKQISTFSDVNLSFLLHPLSKDITKKTDIDAIKFSIKNLLLTRNFEKPFHPEIGTPIYDLLFNNASPILSVVIEKAIIQMIDNYEPRAKIISASVNINNDYNEARITIVFTPININQTVTFDVVIERVR